MEIKYVRILSTYLVWNDVFIPECRGKITTSMYLFLYADKRYCNYWILDLNHRQNSKLLLWSMTWTIDKIVNLYTLLFLLNTLLFLLNTFLFLLNTLLFLLNTLLFLLNTLLFLLNTFTVSIQYSIYCFYSILYCFYSILYCFNSIL